MIKKFVAKNEVEAYWALFLWMLKNDYKYLSTIRIIDAAEGGKALFVVHGGENDT